MKKTIVAYQNGWIPNWYKCKGCGKFGVKLWRDSQMFSNLVSLSCAMCAVVYQNVRIYHCINRNGSHESKDGTRSDQIGDLFPAVPCEDEGFYGYTSLPDRAVEWWKRLPIESAYPPSKEYRWSWYSHDYEDYHQFSDIGMSVGPFPSKQMAIDDAIRKGISKFSISRLLTSPKKKLFLRGCKRIVPDKDSIDTLIESVDEQIHSITGNSSYVFSRTSIIDKEKAAQDFVQYVQKPMQRLLMKWMIEHLDIEASEYEDSEEPHVNAKDASKT